MIKIVPTTIAFLTAFSLSRGVDSDHTIRPNFVIILADDQGWGDLSLNGNTSVRTPHIDSLARDGARFDRFYVQPVCSPTRAEFLTGRWHPRGGVRGVSTGAERLDLDERTVAEAFKAAGYATGCFGKWHNGSQYPYHPNGRGFDEYYGFTSGHWGEYFDPPLDHNGQAVKGEGFLPDDLTGRAIRFVTASARAGRPFFCYLAFNTPHSPMQVPNRYWERFENATVQPSGDEREDAMHTRAALAMCENLDDNVGRMLSALRDQKLERNTIVVYFSDNGPNGARWNGGMKGRKGSTDEGGVRSPLLIRWPGKVQPGTVVTPIAGAVDLYPTLVELAGIRTIGNKPLDGISLAPWIFDQKDAAPDRVLFQHWSARVSARDQRYRLDATGKLFDLTTDGGQQRDLAAERPDDARRLTQAVDHWKREVLGELPKTDDRPFPVGFAEFPRAFLPARDGVPHGGVRRSASAPNCSFFTQWTSPDDQMTWEVEVHTAGRYEAVIHYTCPSSSIGSTVELTLNSIPRPGSGPMKWSGTITEAFDPPLRGHESDRVPRGGESYVKDFRPLSLGVVELAKGRGTLSLSASRMTGPQVADIRGVELVLVRPSIEEPGNLRRGFRYPTATPPPAGTGTRRSGFPGRR